MIVEQIYTKCLSQGSYYIESGEEAAVIDPLREIDSYIERAAKGKAKIKYVFETHFHADFVSGHLSLSKKTNAPIIFGPNADPSFESKIAVDGEKFKLGKITLQLIHTPGHTMESSCYLLRDEDDREFAIFTGDTLFLGDVGRPDLAQENKKLSKEYLAGQLFDSLRNKLMPLPDSITIYPAHGAGSACGKNMMDLTSDSLANQKKVNYALRKDMTKEEFINEVTKDLSSPPKYFPSNVKLNKGGYEDVSTIIKKNLNPISIHNFNVLRKQGDVLILDVRSKGLFSRGHIPGSLFVGLEGMFAPWAGTLIKDINQKIIIVSPKGKEEEAISRLARVGFDNVVGFLDGGFDRWVKSSGEIKKIECISAKEFVNKSKSLRRNIYDVRGEDEFKIGHFPGAKNIPLKKIDNYISELRKCSPFYIYCKGGYRSVIASSIISKENDLKLINIEGGHDEIEKLNFSS
ncbi:MAG: MBL fold metallo-hydrolase [Flavobacteriales bacterium]|nr:MAG: MBL fold metallo-hydrolase [Flavobacteriales bacterium]